MHTYLAQGLCLVDQFLQKYSIEIEHMDHDLLTFCKFLNHRRKVHPLQVIERKCSLKENVIFYKTILDIFVIRLILIFLNHSVYQHTLYYEFDNIIISYK